MYNLFKKLFFLSIVSSFFTNLLAYTISLEDYRTQGISSLEKTMDKKLTQKEYWSQHLQNIDTKFGYIEQHSQILTCNKTKSTLTLYKKNTDNKYQFIKEHHAYTGKNKGDKVVEGDKKTPIGIYKIVEKLSKETKLDPFYGPLAFVTSYPNVYDKFLGKNGYGIWIHGLPVKQKRDEFTRGCIAIQNSNIECLGNNIDIKSTLLIINEQEVKKEISKDLLASLLAQLYQWRYTWLYNDIDRYLSFYSKDFVRTDGMSYEKFKNYKTRVFNKGEKKTIIFTDINLIPYPNKKDVYQITFKEYYKSSSFEFLGDKTLMIKVDENHKMKIFTEK